MPGGLPAITGYNLISLLKKDGWKEAGHRTHGLAMVKEFPDGRKRVTIIPHTSDSLPQGTLHDILGSKQTGLGRRGLERLMNK